MTHIEKINKVLRNNRRKGATAVKISNQTGVPLPSVYKRIHEMRVRDGNAIVSVYRNVKGRRVAHYVAA